MCGHNVLASYLLAIPILGRARRHGDSATRRRGAITADLGVGEGAGTPATPPAASRQFY
jgi:hypothetical protein